MQQLNFLNLTKGRDSGAITSAEDFDSRLNSAQDKIERQLSWPEEQLEKFMKSEAKKDFKLNLREQFHVYAAERKP